MASPSSICWWQASSTTLPLTGRASWWGCLGCGRGALGLPGSERYATHLVRARGVKESLHGKLRSSISALLNHVRGVFDIVLIDCPPGLSVLTESWLREADFHLSPTKPDYVSTCGLEVFRRFKGLNPEMGFAENLGVIVNMKDAYSSGRRRLSALADGEPRQPLLFQGRPAPRAPCRWRPSSVTWNGPMSPNIQASPASPSAPWPRNSSTG